MTPSNEDLEQAREDLEELGYLRAHRGGEEYHDDDIAFIERAYDSFFSVLAEVRRLRQHSVDVWHKFDKADEKSHPPQRGFYWTAQLIRKSVHVEQLSWASDSFTVSLWAHYVTHWQPITTPEPPKEEL